MDGYFKFIDHCHGLITQEVLDDPLQSRLIKSKLKSYKVLYSNNLQIKEIIDNIIEEFFPDPKTDNQSLSITTNVDVENASTNQQLSDKSIYLGVNYSQDEINKINQLFGFVPSNSILTASMLESGYLQNQNIPEIRKWYDRLKFYHFTDLTRFTSAELKALHQEFDLKSFGGA